jgi:hypothetical protein
LLASVSVIDSLTPLKIEGWTDGNGSVSLNETGGSGVDVMDGEECIASGLRNVAGELDDKVPAANFHAPSTTVFHENGTVGEESAADGVGTSVSGSTAGLVDGSTAKIDSLGSVRSGARVGLDN